MVINLADANPESARSSWLSKRVDDEIRSAEAVCCCWMSKRVDAEVRSAAAYQPDAVDDCPNRVQMKKSVSAGVHQNQLDSEKLFQNSFDVDCPSQLVLLIVVKLRQLLTWIAVSALNTVSQVYHLKLGF